MEVRKCPECGKLFTVLYPHLWAYKKGYRDHWDYLCSWSCLRKKQREDEERKAARDMKTHRDRIRVAEEILQLYEGGATRKQVMDYLRGLGYAAPVQAWNDIKRQCKKSAPELYAKLPMRMRSEEKTKREETVVEESEKLPEEAQAVKGPVSPEELTEEFGKRGWEKFPNITNVELVYDPSIAEEYRREHPELYAKAEDMNIREEEEETYQVTAIRCSVGEFYFDHKHGTIDWRNEYGEEVSLLPVDWKKLGRVIPWMMEKLGAEQYEEYTGNDGLLK